jgi:glycosyltransferase involved in cell wall biosynthesis
MKILQLSNKVPYPPRDGGSVATMALAQGLADAGHEVTLLAMNTPKHYVNPEELEQVRNSNLRIVAVPVNTRINPLAALSNLLFSNLPYNAVRFRSARFANRLSELLDSEEFDFVILENLYTFLYKPVLDQHPRLKVIMRPHNVEHEIWQQTALGASGVKKWYLSLLASRIKRFELKQINQYNALVPISPADSKKFTEFGNRKPYHILPTGWDQTDIAAEPQTGAGQTVGHLGALDWIPNQEGILWFLKEVWPLVREKVPQAEFNLAGRNASPEFTSRVKSLGARFMGEIHDTGAFLRGQSVMVIPVFSGSGIRIKMLEYLSKGKAVVSTSKGAGGIALTPGREAFLTDEPGAFAYAVISLLNSPAERKSMGHQALQFVSKEYDNHALIQGFTKFLEGLS